MWRYAVWLGVALLGLAPAAFLPGAAAAQVPSTIAVSDTVWEIRLADGSTIIGQIIEATPDRLTVRTLSGVTIELERPLIRAMARQRGNVRDGQLWPADPNRTRLFFGPTGRMLNQNEGYISVFELFLPFVSYGVTDYLTLAGGTPIVPEGIGRIWYLAPKVGAQLGERTSLSAGVLAFFESSDELDDVGSLGILYAVGTHGTEDTAITGGIGFGFAGDDVENRPLFLLGGETRVSPRIKLLTENYFITYRQTEPDGESTALASALSGGVRFIGGRLSADAGVAVLLDEEDSFCCLPLVNFVYNF
jgi:hypothetical protein